MGTVKTTINQFQRSYKVCNNIKRVASINKERVRELQKEGLTFTAIARALDISRMSVYRVLK
jgi:DNA invertase Pin-like site-specific DNA recombinase